MASDAFMEELASEKTRNGLFQHLPLPCYNAFLVIQEGAGVCRNMLW